ncbi:MAG TPA: ABC transporter ATP-binding protein, partial [Microvirga sp.]|nr:ABC transporter ATP-binding protein [Microvirga sp.]
MSLLAVRGLCKTFGGVDAARDVSFAVEGGEMIALIGPNGA